MMLLAFILPVLAVTTHDADRPVVQALSSSNVTGDVLNVTQCYCTSANQLASGAMLGYYVRGFLRYPSYNDLISGGTFTVVCTLLMTDF